MSQLSTRVAKLERSDGARVPRVELVNWTVCYPKDRQPVARAKIHHHAVLHDGRKLTSRKGEFVDQLMNRAKTMETQPAPERAHWVITDHVGGGGNEQSS
jgi:hypothetical protein